MSKILSYDELIQFYDTLLSSAGYDDNVEEMRSADKAGEPTIAVGTGMFYADYHDLEVPKSVVVQTLEISRDEEDDYAVEAGESLLRKLEKKS